MNYIANHRLFEDERVRIVSKMVEKDKVFIDLELVTKECYECPNCGSIECAKNGYQFKYPILSIVPHYKNICKLSVQRMKRIRCGKSFLDETKIAFKSDAISKSTKFQILFDLKKDISFTQIALKNDVGLDTVIDVFNKYVSIPKMSLPETICIDEFKNLRSAKGKYAFLVLDPINHKVIEVLESRQAEDLKDYFYSLGNEERNNVKYVASDMNEVYRYILKKYFPNATYVVDCFHYLRYVEDAFNKVRIRVQKKYKTDDARYKMLKTYWKILSNYVVTLESNELMNYISGNKTNIDDIINDSLSIDSELETA